MTIVLAVLCILLVLVLAAVLVGSHELVERERRATDNEISKHEACHAEIETILGARDRTRNQSAVLREMADKWDHIESQPGIRRLAEAEYRPGGPSVPSIWMRRMADELDGRVQS